MNFVDALFFLVLAALVGALCRRAAAGTANAGTANAAGVAVILFAAFWGLAGTLIWMVGHLQLSALSCAAVFLVLLAWLWALPRMLPRLLPVSRAGQTPPRDAAAISAKKPGGLEKALLLYIAACSALTLFLTLAPPNASDYDSLVYHLAAPAQFLRAGRVVELPYDHHTYFPFTLEMLYAAGLSWRGPIFAKLFHWLMLPTGAALLMALGRRFVSVRAGLFAAALWASLPVVQSEATTAYIDLGLAVFALGAVYCFLAWRENDSARWMAACGVFCGLCLGSKYLGALVCIWLALWIVGISVREKRSFKPVFPAVVLALLIGGGWYLRNWLWVGNPVFPFAYGLFGGRGWTAEMAAAYARDQKAFGVGQNLPDLIRLPWLLSFSPLNLRIVDGQPKDVFETRGMLFASVLGPALLAFGAPLLAMRRKPAAVGFALWTVLFLFAFWALTGQYLRYLIPAYALGCLACGFGLERYSRGGAVLRWAAGLSLLAWLGFTPVLTAWQGWYRVPVITGQQTAEQYLRSTPGYEAMQWASVNTPPEARFAVWGEPRCYYLQREYFWADNDHNNLLDYGRPLLPQLKDLGATHVLVNEEARSNGGFGEVPEQWRQVVADGGAQELFASRGYRIYVLK